MRRLLPILLLLVALPAVPRSSVAGAVRPDSFEYLVMPVSGFNEIVISYSYSGLGWADMFVTEFADAQGRTAFVNYHLNYHGRDSAYEVRVGDQAKTIYRTDPWLPSYLSFWRPPTPGPGSWDVLRVGVASWGGRITFQVTVDGVTTPSQSGDPSRVTIARKMEFTGGLAAAAGPVDAAVATTYTVTGQGYMLGYFMPHSLGAGSATHDGKPVARDGRIAEPGSGEWVFSITAAADVLSGNTPVLWLMDFPDSTEAQKVAG